ncbi:MAG: protein kinase [Deltaproteobacteria bacterium]|nr:protein kinase [Deltaproteobacteria bacterium]
MFIPFQLGRYTVTGCLGTGGMSEVLEGQLVDDEGEIVRVAIKRPLPGVGGDSRLLTVFWEECALCERLKHPAFPRFIESTMAGGIPVMAMELVRGRRLREILRGRAPGELGANPATWVHLAASVAEALHALHGVRGERGRPVLHGDVNPSNLLLDLGGAVRVVDLGVAAGLSAGLLDALPGHKGYHPPYLSLSVRDPGPDLDTYATARVLVECLAGTDPQVAMERGLPEGLVTVLSRALDPGGMYVYRSAGQLALDLRSFIREDRREDMRRELAILAAAPTPFSG